MGPVISVGAACQGGGGAVALVSFFHTVYFARRILRRFLRTHGGIHFEGLFVPLFPRNNTFTVFEASRFNVYFVQNQHKHESRHPDPWLNYDHVTLTGTVEYWVLGQRRFS